MANKHIRAFSSIKLPSVLEMQKKMLMGYQNNPPKKKEYIKARSRAMSKNGTN